MYLGPMFTAQRESYRRKIEGRMRYVSEIKVNEVGGGGAIFDARGDRIRNEEIKYPDHYTYDRIAKEFLHREKSVV